MVYDAQLDMKQDRTLKVIRKETTIAKGTIIFDPDSFKGQNLSFSETGGLIENE